MTNQTSALSRFSDGIHIILGPARSGTTMLAMALTGSPNVGYYAHEPFETLYYQKDDKSIGYDRILQAIPISKLRIEQEHPRSERLLIKEMTFQVHSMYEEFITLSKYPIIFHIRNPLVTMESRLRMKKIMGLDTHFPLNETGWTDISGQIEVCERMGKDYIIVDMDNLLSSPEETLQKICDRSRLTWSPECLRWNLCDGTNFDPMGCHSELYKKIIKSKGIKADHRKECTIEDFADRPDVQEYLQAALHTYRTLLNNVHRV